MAHIISRTDQADIKQFTIICQQFLGKDLVSIILFGSVARGKSNRYSDIDFCVVTKKNRESEKYKMMKFFHRNCDLIMRTERNLADYLYNLSALDLDIAQDGKVVYGANVMKKQKKVFANVKKKYRLKQETEWGKGVWHIGAAS